MIKKYRLYLFATILLAGYGCSSSDEPPPSAEGTAPKSDAPAPGGFPSNAELAGENVVLSVVGWKFGGGVTNEKGNGFEIVRIGWSGSGVLVRKDGTLATNYHVAARALQIEASFDAMADKGGATYKVPFIKVYDKINDLAIMKIDGAPNFEVADLGDSDQVQPRDDVLAVGNPMGIGINITDGKLSQVRNDRKTGKPAQLVHTALIAQGNSGGSLYKGPEVIGINNAILTGTGFGIAIPSNFVKTLLDNPEYDRQLLLTDVFSDDFGNWSNKLNQVAAETATVPATPGRDQSGIWSATVQLLPQTDYVVDLRTGEGIDLDLSIWSGNAMIGLANGTRGGVENLAISNTNLGAPEVRLQVHNYRNHAVNFGVTLYKIAW